MTFRKEKIHELYKNLAAEFVTIVSAGPALITITHAEVAPNEKIVKIFFTVLPDDQENGVENFLNRKRSEFVEFIEKKAKIGRMPNIEFKIDVGEKNRQRIDFLLKSE